MKSHTPAEREALADARRELCRAFLSMRNEGECAKLLEDLCTPAELEAIADRWRVVRLLREELTYREIHSATGVSVTTIGRVARFLSQGNGGYRIAAERLYGS